MKWILSFAAIAALVVGCATTATNDRTIRDPAGAMRPWEPADIDMNHSAVPVNTSTDTDKHIWTQSPIPNVPSQRDPWRNSY
jgi:hypothetical protein